MLTAARIMSTDIATIRSDATIEESISLLLKRDISGLPVTDSSGKLVGIITEFALLAMAYDRDVLSDKVQQHMTRDLITVESDAPVNKLADLFILHRVRRLLVLDEGNLVGTISRHDVLRALHEARPPVCTA